MALGQPVVGGFRTSDSRVSSFSVWVDCGAATITPRQTIHIPLRVRRRGDKEKDIVLVVPTREVREGLKWLGDAL
jgi:hypothetical protein